MTSPDPISDSDPFDQMTLGELKRLALTSTQLVPFPPNLERERLIDEILARLAAIEIMLADYAFQKTDPSTYPFYQQLAQIIIKAEMAVSRVHQNKPNGDHPSATLGLRQL
ncbi:MAG: hypothetical protein A2527_03245 [Candidatus Lambdaproteobacteria bacterium RIFOXYD2_FULL_50_16]|uniref:Uncharacterized protein n=1 Tax=Candidatus Lambdaproteobacteria bacterium RIFOXYD2_FULL_50_16 TaxID=1817772 RepID=A0A1F6GEQ9_9PROT|nr:MAG: hypothetical protein A2527_03245 [Candidatus Lambdaproteobacteria bacterium RIFOXYD2_FULL_50_16]